MERGAELPDALGVELKGEEIAARVCPIEDPEPGGRAFGLLEPEALDEDLVVGYRDGDVHEPVREPRNDRDASGVSRGVQLDGKLIAGRRGGVERSIDHREQDGLTAVIAEAELAKHLDRRRVVAKVRAAEARGLDAGVSEDLQRARDRVALLSPLEHGVVAVYEAVHGELGAAVDVSPEQLRVPREHARGRRPRRTDTELRGDRVVAVEALRHRG